MVLLHMNLYILFIYSQSQLLGELLEVHLFMAPGDSL